MKPFVVFLLALVAVPAIAQEPKFEPKEAAAGTFHRAFLQAVENGRKERKITRRQALTLRIRMLSPAFRKHVQDVAVTQLFFSGDDKVPLTPEGKVDVAGIDWDSETFLKFLEALIPIIQQLLEIFASLPGESYARTIG